VEVKVEIESNSALKVRAMRVLAKLGCELPKQCDAEMILTALRLLRPKEYHAARSRAELLGGRKRWHVMRDACDAVIASDPALFLPSASLSSR
jgi:hypothetical protein